MRRALDRWSHFWFEAEHALQLKTFRIVFGALLTLNYLFRTPDVGLFFSERGVMSTQALSQIESPVNNFSLFSLVPGDSALWPLHWAQILSLTFFTLGIRPRLFALISFLLQVSFLKRNFSVSYGFDLISVFMLFYFCLADFRTVKKLDFKSDLGSVSLRLMQIQICVVYFFAGIDKLQGFKWWNGTAIWDFFANSLLARWDLSWVAHYPALLCLMTFLTFLWEIYFPVLVWFKSTRRWILLGGVVFHLGILLTAHLPFFALLMISTYIVFLPTPVLKKAWSRVPSRSTLLGDLSYEKSSESY